MLLDKGMAFMSDTRTNSGVDNISTFRKMHSFEKPGERYITIMTAGNLATTQSVISMLAERTIQVVLVEAGKPVGHSPEPKIAKSVRYTGEAAALRL